MGPNALACVTSGNARNSRVVQIAVLPVLSVDVLKRVQPCHVKVFGMILPPFSGRIILDRLNLTISLTVAGQLGVLVHVYPEDISVDSGEQWQKQQLKKITIMTTRLVNCLANEHIQQKHCGTVQQAWSCKRYANQCPSNRKQSNRTTNGPRTSECEHPERSSSDMPLGSLCSARFNVMAPMRAPQCIGATRESLRRLMLKNNHDHRGRGATTCSAIRPRSAHTMPTQCPHNVYVWGGRDNARHREQCPRNLPCPRAWRHMDRRTGAINGF